MEAMGAEVIHLKAVSHENKNLKCLGLEVEGEPVLEQVLEAVQSFLDQGMEGVHQTLTLIRQARNHHLVSWGV